MYISYSGWKKYKECPRAYWHSYINKTQLPTPDNRVGMLYGSIVGTLFEFFYNRKMWKSPDPTSAVMSCVDDVTRDIMAKEGRSGVFNWKDPKLKKGPHSIEALKKMVRKSVPNGVEIIRSHRLLGTDAVAEDKLDTVINGHMIGGRCDFVMTRISPLRDHIILDGKGSSYRDQYVDVRQLHWYSMLERKRTRALPDQVAFIFWRFPPDKAVDWSTPTKMMVDELQEDVLDTIATIEAKKRLPMANEEFHAKASASNCRFCSYVFACPEGQVMTSEDRPEVSPASGVEDVALDE
jgi:hypothetical protein